MAERLNARVVGVERVAVRVRELDAAAPREAIDRRSDRLTRRDEDLVGTVAHHALNLGERGRVHRRRERSAAVQEQQLELCA